MAHKEGEIITSQEFVSLGTRSAVDQTLSRLARKGVIRRIQRGIYERPRFNSRLGITVSPSPERVVKALVGRNGKRLLISGAQAANILGLSTQVPAHLVYLTDGYSRTIQLGKQTIELRHTSSRTMATTDSKAGIVIQALKHLGRTHVDNKVIIQLKNSLSIQDKEELKKHSMNAPLWMQPSINQIVDAEGQ